MPIGLPPELPRRIPPYWEVDRRWVPYAFLETSSELRREKNHFPRAEEMANYRKRLLTDSPTGPSFSTARRERSEDLSHIRETLNSGVPGPP